MEEIRYIGFFKLPTRKDKTTCSLFKCPACGKYVIKPREKGIINKTCGVDCKSKKDNRLYISKNINGVSNWEHRLIMEEHIGRKLLHDEVVHHIDGNGKNNDINNLVIMNESEHHSIHTKGENNALSKLTDNDVIEIRRRHSLGETYKSISKDFPVTLSGCQYAGSGKTWKHVDV